MYAFVCDCVCVMQRESKHGLVFSMILWGVVLNNSRELRDWSFHDFGILEFCRTRYW